MAKWEYCVITGCRGDAQFRTELPTLGRFDKKGLYTTQLGRKEAKEAGFPAEVHLVASTIAQLGADGWEMVGCGVSSPVIAAIGPTGLCTHSIYFKRQIADSD